MKFSNDIPANGYLNFKFPSDFSIDTSTCQFSIPSTSISGITSFSSCQGYANPCQITSQSICTPVQNLVTKNTDYFMQIKGFKNPRSVKPTDSVEVISKTSSFDDINQGKVFFIKMLTLDSESFNTLSILPSNTTNGAVNDYTFTVRSPTIAFVNKDILQIQMPNEVLLPGQVTCSVKSGFAKIGCSNAG